MTVVIVKRECDRHPGCYMLAGKCERCVVEDFSAALVAKFRDALDVARAAGKETT